MRRTLERHIGQWRALEGPSKEVFFPQTYQPGVRGLSDFTHMEELGVTIAGVAFGHLLYHFVLAFSRWEYASVVDGGESFQALAAGCRTLYGRRAAVPASTVPTVCQPLSRTFRRRRLYVRYAALLEHYGMKARAQSRPGHENGSVESSHRYLKTQSIRLWSYVVIAISMISQPTKSLCAAW